MKKIVALAGILLLGAGSAFAGNISAGKSADAYTAPSGTRVQEKLFKLSNGVNMGFLTGVDQFSLTTGHLNGDKTFGVTSTDGKTFYATKDTGVTAPAPSASDSTAFSSFTSM